MSYNDAAVYETANDAAQAKLNCHKLHYTDDPYIQYFTKHNINHSTYNTVAPLINRGYYTRTYAITQIVIDYIQLCHANNTLCQIISLGAGNDTLYWRLRDLSLTQYTRNYIECDFEYSVLNKAKIISKHSELNPDSNSAYHNSSSNTTSQYRYQLQYHNYQLLPCNLRDVEQLKHDLETQCDIDYNVPTLVLSECVLIYLDKQYTDSIIQYFGTSFHNCMFIDYIPINPSSRFGQTMMQNLNQRQCNLLSYLSYPSIQSYCDRYKLYGMTCTYGYTMYDMYYTYITSDERKRIESIEFMDEYEEWEIMMSHYAIVIGIKNKLLNNIGTMKICTIK